MRAIELAIGMPEVDLLPVTASRDAVVVETAAWALGERGADQRARSSLGSRRSQPTTPMRSCARPRSRRSARSATRPGCPPCSPRPTDKPAVRRRAVVALAAFEGPEVDAALERAKEDRDWQVRQIAEDLLD